MIASVQFTIESKTAQSLEPRIKEFILHDGAYLSFITCDWDHDPITLTKDIIKELGESYQNRMPDYFSSNIDGRRVIIEYFEPKGIISNFPVLLFQITYFYAG